MRVRTTDELLLPPCIVRRLSSDCKYMWFPDLSYEQTGIESALLKTCQHEEPRAILDPDVCLEVVCIVGLRPVGLAQGQPSQF